MLYGNSTLVVEKHGETAVAVDFLLGERSYFCSQETWKVKKNKQIC